MEGHIITSLSNHCHQLILIGDHKQLKPNPTVYKLAKDYNLDLSLFERMINNKVDFKCLELQHRMRPQISELMKIIYPELKDHPVVEDYPNIKGISKNMFFIQHDIAEVHDDDQMSHANPHEAQYLVALCRYLLLHGYRPDMITILTMYSGQIFELRKMMPKSEFEGVRVTAVDNYQGEECEVILISLVRSNDDGKIGFLKIENRICVALSRAKHGLYVMGNLTIMSESSSMWSRIIQHAKRTNVYGEALPLFCQNHPKEDGILAKNPRDFKNAPEGGCMKPCQFRISCGHTCPKVCHILDQGHNDIR